MDDAKNVIDIYQTYNQYDHGTQSGTYVGNIKDYVLTIDGDETFSGWKGSQGDLLKNLLKKMILIDDHYLGLAGEEFRKNSINKDFIFYLLMNMNNI